MNQQDHIPGLASVTRADPASGTAAAPAILCEELVVGYGSLIAVDRLSLVVRRGECFGLVGPNGAGKTSTMEVFEGLLRPRSGKVEVLGESWGRSGASDRRMRERMGVALQETRLPEKLTVHEVVRVFRSFYRSGRRPDELIAMLGLTDKRNARAGELSGGQRQRLAVACALAGSPELLFLDEPTTGLDPSARRDIWDHIQRFAMQGGTVLITTHYMEEAERLCNRVAVVDRGRLAALGTPAALVETLGAREIIEIETHEEFPADAVASLPEVREVRRRAGRFAVYVQNLTQALPAVLGFLSGQGVRVRSSSTHPANLEDVFIHITGRGLGDESPGVQRS